MDQPGMATWPLDLQRMTQRHPACSTGTASEAAYNVLSEVLHERHGDLGQHAALMFHRLTPSLLGMSSGSSSTGSKKGATQEVNSRRTSAMAFVKATVRLHPAAFQALVALCKQLCLKALDNANARAHAVTSLLELVRN